MLIPPILELMLVGVREPGVPNNERILLRVIEGTNLAQYGIIVGIRNEAGMITPMQDYFFWFGEQEVISTPAWLIVYTGPGNFKVTNDVNTNDLIYIMHWGRQYTMFNSSNIVPVVINIGGILVGNLSLPAPS